MTDGTSQGLFIVVAIVIFGIFVVMAYILFEDTLSPTLASMFTDATETATQRLTQETDERFFQIDNTGKIIDYADFDTSDDIELPKKVIIPKAINGITVTSIGPKAFMNKGITHVKIPDTVVKIDNGASVYTGAFYGNPIKKLEIPSSVRHIGSFAFMRTEIEQLTLNEGTEYIASHAFTYTFIQDVKIPNTVTDIGTYAFSGSHVQTIDLGEGIEGLGEFAFSVNNIKEVTLPKSLRNVGKMIFMYNGNLTTINVSESMKAHILANIPEFMVKTSKYNSETGQFYDKAYFPESILKTY